VEAFADGEMVVGDEYADHCPEASSLMCSSGVLKQWREGQLGAPC
jgi:hypothetical protein